MLRRDTVLEAIAKSAPEIYAFVHAKYYQRSQLQINKHIIMLEECPQQADPPGSLEFCITQHPLLQKLKVHMCEGYLDDLTFGGHQR